VPTIMVFSGISCLLNQNLCAGEDYFHAYVLPKDHFGDNFA
jgi:hypothetical protein